MESIPIKLLVLISGDINFTETNWKAFIVHKVYSILVSKKSDSWWRSKVRKNLCINGSQGIRSLTECNVNQNQPVAVKFRSFGSADYEGINDYSNSRPIKPYCYTNINKMNREINSYIDTLIEFFVPKRTNITSSCRLGYQIEPHIS